MALLFPRTHVYVPELDTMTLATLVDESTGLFECDIEFPANLTNTDIMYLCEVYCNELATGITSTIVVEASKNPDDYYKVIELLPDVTEVPDEGGTVTCTVRFYMGDTYIAVSGLVDIIDTAYVGLATPLTATVQPNIATNSIIQWSIADTDTGETSSTIENGSVTSTTAGALKVQAKIENGEDEETDYVKTIDITVKEFYAVTGITGIPSTVSGAMSTTLEGVVEPANASNQTVVYTVSSQGTTGATIVNNVLSATNYGTVEITATIKNGKLPSEDYVDTFNVEFVNFVAVTDLQGIDNQNVPAMTYDLSAVTVEPSNASNQSIVWSVFSQGTTGATISNNNTVNATAAGTAVIRASIASGFAEGTAYVEDFDLTFYTPVSTVTLSDDMLGDIGVGTSTLSVNIEPAEASQDVVWEVIDAGTTGATISGDQLTTTASGDVVVRATIEEV